MKRILKALGKTLGYLSVGLLIGLTPQMEDILLHEE